MIQESTAVRDAVGNARETAIGASPIVRIFDGSMPASVADADAGTELVEIQCPADAMTASSGGVKTKNGTWAGTASAEGQGSYFRMYASDGTTCHRQGSVDDTGTPDMLIDNVDIADGQLVTVVVFTLTEGNA